MGDDAWFKSTRRTFLFLVVTLWKKIIVAHANGTHWKKVSAVMVKANIVQISDTWMTDGKKDSCIMYTIHPDIAKDPILKEKLSECVDYIRDNYDMEIFTKI